MNRFFRRVRNAIRFPQPPGWFPRLRVWFTRLPGWFPRLPVWFPRRPGWFPKSFAARIALPLAVAVGLAGTGALVWVRVNPNPKVIVGKVPLDEPSPLEPVALVLDDFPERREPPPPPPPSRAGATGGVPRFSPPQARGLWPPDGRPPGPARPYNDAVDDSGGLQFVAILGSDARSGNPANSRADSIHVLALDPKARRGTIVGIPRDAWVDIPGHGKRKINEALNIGGPDLAVRTLRNVTGMPITYYVLTAFQGMRALVNELGGVDAYVPYDMNDVFSGAYFQKGWHRMDGEKALAFSRNRHVPAGDFARSENQGRLMIDGLKKLRAETSTRGEVEAWVRILVRHTRIDMSFSDTLKLAVLARVTAASSVRNLVAPGRVGTAGRASVVFLTDQAYALFRDVAADAVADGSYPAFGPPHPHDQGTEPEPPPPSPQPSPLPSPSPTLPI